MPHHNLMPPGGSFAWILFTAAIPGLVKYFYLEHKQQDKILAFSEMEENYGIPHNETFDFIIVGAGSAGCVLARRLSEHYTVLLLEAGGDPPPTLAINNIVGYTKALPDIHWFLHSTKQACADLSIGGLIEMTAGKMMGGSGSHNNVQYERGSPFDFDNWANFTGDDSWRYENVLKYFLKTENYKGQFSTVTGQHRKGGLLDVVATDLPFRDDIFFSAGKELGYETGLDPNGPQRPGFCVVEYNRNKGRRVSAYTAYVQPIEGKRKNLTVRRFSVVSEVIIENYRAVGVKYLRHGIPRAAFVSKEVILSAGAYISPVILMKSGIGPKDQLDKKPLLELPVGQFLQTHIVVDISITVTDKSIFKFSPYSVNLAGLNEFTVNGTGLLATRESSNEAFLASSRAAQFEGQPQWSDLQMYLYQGYVNGSDVLNCTVNLNRPRSVGKILLNRSADELEDRLTPILDYNLFSDESDYDVIIEGIQLCQQIVCTETFKKIGASFYEGVIPECKEFANNARDYWICFIKQRSTSNVHASGTVRMGPPGGSNSVLDSKLRVPGIKGLRVVDASIFPFITNANINAPVLMVAEKSADDILQAWNIKK